MDPQPRNLVTFCRSIDTLLGGGVGLGEVTEIAGSPGCGKTQLVMQLSVDARLPVEYGGVAGETVYIDTEGSFSPERCYTMARALVDHVRKSAERKGRQRVPPWFHPDTIMKGIHVYRVHDEAAQTAVIMALSSFLQERATLGCPVKLVVVDSIAFHYRVSLKKKSIAVFRFYFGYDSSSHVEFDFMNQFIVCTTGRKFYGSHEIIGYCCFHTFGRCFLLRSGRGGHQSNDDEIRSSKSWCYCCCLIMRRNTISSSTSFG